MKTVKLPSDNNICALGQGTWNMGDSLAKRSDEIASLQKGIDLGMTLIDTAEMYGNGNAERLVGQAIKGRRDKVFLVTKVLPSNASYNNTLRACDNSLQRLNTNYIDLYLLHWQSNYPFTETLQAFLDLQAAGKIKQWGVSNFDTIKMQEIFSISHGNTCTTNQVLYNLTRRGIEYDLLPWCQSVQMPLMAYSPVEQGRLLKSDVLASIANRHNASASQIALAWVLQQNNVIPIPKASTVAHVEDNFKSLSIELTEEDNAEIDVAFPPPKRKMPLEVI